MFAGRGAQADDAVVAAAGVERAELELRRAIRLQGAKAATMREDVHFTEVFEGNKRFTFGFERAEHNEACHFVNRDGTVGVSFGRKWENRSEHVHGEAFEGLVLNGGKGWSGSHGFAHEPGALDSSRGCFGEGAGVAERD